jgi:PKD repeat protein
VADQPVQFTDTSTGGPTSWQWSFGDGGTSTSQNPSHTYQAIGAFSIRLTVTNTSGSNSTSQTINVIPESAGYYIDTANSSASDSNPGTEALPWKTISKANQTLVAGDTVYVKAGNYANAIAPVNSGTASGRITYRAYGSDVVTIRDTTTAVTLSGKSYITIQGINFYNCDRFMYLIGGANHNIIAYCNFDQVRNRSEWTGSAIADNSFYNWVHHCRFSKYGAVVSGDDRGSVFDIGTEDYTPDLTSHNVIEDCEMFHGGHHVLGVFGMYNVIRRNYFHNEPWMTGTGDRGTTTYGNRNIVFSGYEVNSKMNLFEGNQVGYSSDPPDQVGATGMMLTTAYNIVRFNRFYHNDRSGIAMGLTSTYYSDIIYNKIYNNTFFHNAINVDDDPANAAIFFVVYSGSRVIEHNAIKNNILYRHPLTYSAYGSVSLADQIFAGNWDGDVQGDPLFVNASVALGDPMDASLPDFHLNSSSPCREVGTSLTTITSSSGSGTTFTVADAGYFMDGWGIDGVEGDEIQIVGTSQKARIASVNYTSKTITLNTALTWTQGQGIALAYVGSAPDIGAHEFGSAIR